MSCPRHLVLFICLLFSLSVSLKALGDDGKPIVAIVHSGETKLAERLQAETTLLGFEPRIVERSGTVSPEDLKDIAATMDARALMRISMNGDSIGIWIPSDETDVVVLQEVYVPGERDRDHAIVAFKAGELLRVGMMTPPSPAPGEETPPKPPEPTPDEDTDDIQGPVSPEPAASAPETRVIRKRTGRSPTRKWLSLSLAPAVSYGFGKLPPAFQIGTALTLQVTGRISLALTGLIPSYPMKVHGDDAMVDASAGFVVLGLGFRLTPVYWRVSVPVEAFAGATFLRITGYDRVGDYQSMRQDIMVAVWGGRTGFSAAISETVSIRGDVIAGTCEPEPVAKILGKRWSGWGRPLLAGMLGVEVWLF